MSFYPLYQNLEDHTDLIYLINNRAYSVNNLSYQPNIGPGEITSYQPIIIPREFNSYPVYVVTEEGGWIIFDTLDGQLQIVNEDLLYGESSLFTYVISMEVPDLIQGLTLNKLPEFFPEKILFAFNPMWFRKIVNLAVNELPYSALNLENPHSLPPFKNKLSSDLQSLDEEILDLMFILEQYGKVISYDQAQKMLENGQIKRFYIDENLQLMIPFSSPNKIITLYHSNGHPYIVIAQYLVETNEIYPPN